MFSLYNCNWRTQALIDLTVAFMMHFPHNCRLEQETQQVAGIGVKQYNLVHIFFLVYNTSWMQRCPLIAVKIFGTWVANFILSISLDIHSSPDRPTLDQPIMKFPIIQSYLDPLSSNIWGKTLRASS